MPQTAPKYYYLKDPTKKLVGKHLGSTRVTINSAGNVVSYDDYDPLGLTLSGRSGNIGDATDKFKFTGKERDKETGLDWFGPRPYDSWLGMFRGVDLLADKFAHQSPYVYCGNNPMRFIDPTGMGDEESDKEKEKKRKEKEEKEKAEKEKKTKEVKDGVKLTNITVTGKDGKTQTVKVNFQDTKSDKKSSDNNVNKNLKSCFEKGVQEASKTATITDITITATTNGNHSSNSLHYSGNALDIGAINGKSITSIGNADPVKALQDAFKNQTGTIENMGPSINQSNGKDVTNQTLIDAHKNHIHLGTKE